MTAPEPLISIVIPSVAGSPTVRSLIHHLCHADMGIARSAYEVIVVVDGGEPFPHPSVVNGVSVQVLANHRYRGASGARNTGALAARGRYLWFLDDDIFPSEGAIHRLMTLWETLGEEAVLGITTNQLTYPPEYLKTLLHSIAGRFFVEEYLRLFAAFPEPVPNEFVCSGSMAMKADLFRRVGGFRELPPRSWKGIGIYVGPEDIELSYRLLRAGAQLYFLPKDIVLLVIERTPITARSMVRRAFIDGYGGRILWEETHAQDGKPLPPILSPRIDALLRTVLGWWIGRLAYFLHEVMEKLYRLSGRQLYFYKFLLLARAAYAVQGRRFAEEEMQKGILSQRKYLYDAV